MRNHRLPLLSAEHVQQILHWRVVIVLILASLQILFLSPAADATPATSHNALQQLNKLSQRLISELKAGTAEAMSFRTDVVYYRETLRGIMLKNEKLQHDAKSLLTEMVRMAAYLQSAADCQTGRYISCPANLMRNLEEQQKYLDELLPKGVHG